MKLQRGLQEQAAAEKRLQSSTCYSSDFYMLFFRFLHAILQMTTGSGLVWSGLVWSGPVRAAARPEFQCVILLLNCYCNFHFFGPEKANTQERGGKRIKKPYAWGGKNKKSKKQK